MISAIQPLRLPPTRIVTMVLACGAALLIVPAASGFQLATRWSSTATGSTGSQGSPVKLTWSFAPDGTAIPAPNSGTSSLISFLDTQFGTASGTDLTARPWFAYFSQSFDRWSQLSGVTFTYEPHDNGAQLRNSAGSLGSRGDIRIAGSHIDGASHTLAQTTYPNSGDMQFDTDDGAFFSNATLSHRAFRNTITHEIGHAIGLAHVATSANGVFLMQANNSLNFDGPQIDDILGVQSYYGDFDEKSNGGLGNDTAAHATSLGAIAVGATKSIGTSPAVVAARPIGSQYVIPTDTDFVSIDSSSDADYYSFSVSGAARLSAMLTPRGGSYMQGPVGGSQSLFNASAQSDLTLAIYSTNGTTQLALSSSAPVGQAEIRSNLVLPAAGQYYARVTGAAAAVQLYDLQLAVAAPFLAGDYNRNGKVDSGDYTVWRDTFGRTGLALSADGDGNGSVDTADFGIWKTNFGAMSPGSGAGSGPFAGGAVPEPSAAILLAIGGILWLLPRYYPRKPLRTASHRE